MKLFTIKDDKLTGLKINPFKLEKEIQNLVEKNLDILFNIQFVKSEFSIKNFRIDTLGFNPETKSFVVIEYKKERNFSVIDQGYTYMSIMLNNKSDFILEYNESCGDTLKREDVDWSQTRVIFVSPNYTEYQKQSVNFKDVPFELWEIKRYENEMLGIVQHKNDSDESISIISDNPDNIVKKVTNEVRIYDEEYHLNSSKSRKSWVNELYFSLKDRILGLGDVEIKFNNRWVSFRRKSPFVDLILYDKGISTVINLKDGQLNDPDKRCTRYEGKGHWGNGDYNIIVNQNTDLDYVMFLIRQSYESKG